MAWGRKSMRTSLLDSLADLEFRLESLERAV